MGWARSLGTLRVDACETVGMKAHIRAMIDDLRQEYEQRVERRKAAALKRDEADLNGPRVTTKEEEVKPEA